MLEKLPDSTPAPELSTSAPEEPAPVVSEEPEKTPFNWSVVWITLGCVAGGVVLLISGFLIYWFPIRKKTVAELKWRFKRTFRRARRERLPAEEGDNAPRESKTLQWK